MTGRVGWALDRFWMGCAARSRRRGAVRLPARAARRCSTAATRPAAPRSRCGWPRCAPRSRAARGSSGALELAFAHRGVRDGRRRAGRVPGARRVGTSRRARSCTRSRTTCARCCATSSAASSTRDLKGAADEILLAQRRAARDHGATDTARQSAQRRRVGQSRARGRAEPAGTSSASRRAGPPRASPDPPPRRAPRPQAPQQPEPEPRARAAGAAALRARRNATPLGAATERRRGRTASRRRSTGSTTSTTTRPATPDPCSVRRVTLSHIRRGSGPPLVLLHGVGCQYQYWYPVLDRLAAERDVIARRLPGLRRLAAAAGRARARRRRALADAIARLPRRARTRTGRTSPATRWAAGSGSSWPRTAGRSRSRRSAPPGSRTRSERALHASAACANHRPQRGADLQPRRDGAARPASAASLRSPRTSRTASGITVEEAVARASATSSTRPGGTRPSTSSAGPLLRRRDDRRAGHDALGRQGAPARPARAAGRPLARGCRRAAEWLSGCGHTPMWDDPPQVAQAMLEASAGCI